MSTLMLGPVEINTFALTYSKHDGEIKMELKRRNGSTLIWTMSTPNGYRFDLLSLFKLLRDDIKAYGNFVDLSGLVDTNLSTSDSHTLQEQIKGDGT